MIRRILLAGCFCLISSLVSAGPLFISGQDHVWLDPTTDPSPTFVVSISDSTDAIDALVSWQLGLTIVPGDFAIGTLQFATATAPSDYLLAGVSSGIAPALGAATDTIDAIGDFHSALGGTVDVPQAPNFKNLLATTFVASPDASGVFYITAVGGEFRSAWFDANDVHPYGNVPFDESAILGRVIVRIPEPNAALLAFQGLAAGALLWFGVRRRRT